MQILTRNSATDCGGNESTTFVNLTRSEDDGRVGGSTGLQILLENSIGNTRPRTYDLGGGDVLSLDARYGVQRKGFSKLV